MPGVVWILTSLLAIAATADWVVVGLVGAIFGGIAVGLAAILEMRYPASLQKYASLSAPVPSGEPTSHPPKVSRVGGWINLSLRFVATHELWVLFFLSPLFLFPRRDMIVGLLVVPFLWIVRWRSQGQLTKRTPMDWPIALLLGMVAVGVIVSPDVERSMPKIAGIIFGVSVFYAIVNRIQLELDFLYAIVALAVIGIGIGLVGLVGNGGVGVGKLVPAQIYALIPHTAQVPGTVEGWINPNELGGSLAFIVPFLGTLSLAPWTVRPSRSESGLAERMRHLVKPALWLALVLTSAILVLSQSRSALFGVAVSLLALLVIRWRHFHGVLIALPVGFLALALVFGFNSLVLGTGGGGTMGGTLDFAGRQEVWERAFYAIQDFPFTGVGLNMFDPVSKALYPYFIISPDAALGHAHNLYLQVAVDLGIPGLVAYLALLTSFAYVVCQVFFSKASSFARMVALGVGLGVLAHQIFGFTDAIALGAKPGIIFWIMMGLVVGLWRLVLGRLSFSESPVKNTNSVVAKRLPYL